MQGRLFSIHQGRPRREHGETQSKEVHLGSEQFATIDWILNHALNKTLRGLFQMWLRSKPDNIIKISDLPSIRLLQIIFLPTILATIYEYQPTGFWGFGVLDVF